jgi:hypothetical protein
VKAIVALFDIVPGWVWALITAGALAAAGVSQTRFTHERANHAETRAQHAEQVAQAEQASRIASEKNRKTEQELNDVVIQAQAQAEALRIDLDAARAAGRVASDRLRNAAANAAAAAGARGEGASSAAISEAAANAARVLADVLAEIEYRSGILAEQADRSRAAGLQCEAIHDASVTATQ